MLANFVTIEFLKSAISQKLINVERTLPAAEGEKIRKIPVLSVSQLPEIEAKIIRSRILLR